MGELVRAVIHFFLAMFTVKVAFRFGSSRHGNALLARAGSNCVANMYLTVRKAHIIVHVKFNMPWVADINFVTKLQVS